MVKSNPIKLDTLEFGFGGLGFEFELDGQTNEAVCRKKESTVQARLPEMASDGGLLEGIGEELDGVMDGLALGPDMLSKVSRSSHG